MSGFKPPSRFLLIGQAAPPPIPPAPLPSTVMQGIVTQVNGHTAVVAIQGGLVSATFDSSTTLTVGEAISINTSYDAEVSGPLFAVNVGGAGHQDTTGGVWTTDADFTGGTVVDWTGTPTLGVVDYFVYNTVRNGVGTSAGAGFQYAIPVPLSGKYVVSLLFVEHLLAGQANNQRLTDIWLGARSTGTLLVDQLDIFNCALTAYGDGSDYALLIERTVTVSGTTINLDFAPHAGTVLTPGSIAAIRIRAGVDAVPDPAPLHGSNVGPIAAINSGGPAYTPATGFAWSVGTTGETGGATANWTGTPTGNVVDQTIYNTEQAGLGIGPTDGFQYAITVPGAGNYVVTTYWVEHFVQAQANAQRLVDVWQGARTTGTLIVDQLDPYNYATAAFGQGANEGFTIERNVTTVGTTLALDFAPHTGTVWAPGALAGVSVRTGNNAASDLAPLHGNGSVSRLPGTRTLFVADGSTSWPYADNSPRNTPIGSAITGVPAGIVDPTDGIRYDPIFVFAVSNSDPATTVATPANFANRDGLNPTIPGFVPTVNGTLPHFPTSVTIADAVLGGAQPNCVTTIIDPDGTCHRINAVERTSPGSQVFGYNYGNTDGHGTFSAGPVTAQFPHGGHASQLDGMSGALCQLDYTSTVIRHALALSLNGPRNYTIVDGNGAGWQWPALSADGYANQPWTADGRGTSPNGTHYAKTYGSLNPSAKLHLGSLVYFPAGVTPASLSITTPLGLKTFYAFQQYGAYIVDDAAGYDFYNASNLIIATDAITACSNAGGFATAYLAEVRRMLPALYMATNNTATSIGGGGTLGQPLAPLPA